MVFQQSYRDKFSLIILTSILGLAFYKLIKITVMGNLFSIQAVTLFAAILILAIGIYTLIETKLQVKFGRKKIAIKMTPFKFYKVKFNKSKIDRLEFFKTDPITKSSGLFIHFGINQRIFNFGGNKGMQIQLKNGKIYTFFSENLYDRKEEIGQVLT